MRASLLTVLALLLTGCFQLSSVLTVRADGSGTFREEVTLSGMGLMALANEGEDGADPWADMDLDERAAGLGEGVRLASFEPTEEGFVAVYDVDDVGAFTYSTQEDLAPDDGPELAFQFGFSHGADGGPATLRVFVPKPDAGKPAPPSADDDGPDMTEQALGLMRSFLGDARMTVAVEVEGELLGTTARHVDGNRITLFDLPFDDFLDAMAENPEWMAGGQPDPSVVLREMNAIEGVRVQPPGPVRVRFQ